jgi:type IV pilus assembly protein PilC
VAKTFAYRAKDSQGQVITGSILADNENAVAVHIRGDGYFITQIKEQGDQKSLLTLIENLHSVNIRDIAIFCRLFSTMIDAGLSLVTALNVLIEQTDNRRLKTALQDVYKKIKEGEALSRALGDHPRVFPSIMINMVEAGEMGGMLDDAFSRLAIHFEKEYKMNEKIKSAMAYPVVVCIIAVLAVSFILTNVLPTFVGMFEEAKINLPLLTSMLLLISVFLRNNALIIMAVMVVVFYGLRLTLQKEKFKKKIDTFTLKLPFVGMLTRKIGIARFSRTFSTLLHSGVPIITALEVVQKTIGNLRMMEALAGAQDGIKEGRSLALTLAESKMFTPMVTQMVSIGEESGALDKMLEKVADFYESDVDDVITRLNSIIEPLIIVALGIVIGVIVLAIMIPMFDIMSGAAIR